MKQVYVTNLREGDKVDDVFVVASRSLLRTRAGDPFLKAKLTDKTGTVDAIKWNATESEIARLVEGTHIRVHGTVRLYNNELQLNLDSFETIEEDVDASDYVASSERDPDEMFAELQSLLSDVTDANLRRLLDAFFADDEFAGRFREAPAAKSIHHAYVGGLLEHTLNVVRNCSVFAELYPDADRELLLTAAALHDAGKVDEYKWSPAIDLSTEGHFVGHVVGGAMMVRAAVESVEGFDPLVGLALQHAIVAHHGTKEFGSPKRPKTIEALMLHFADDLDAQVEIFRQAIKRSDQSGEGGLFTPRRFPLERPIFKGLSRQGTEETPQAGEEPPDTELSASDADYDPFAED